MAIQNLLTPRLSLKKTSKGDESFRFEMLADEKESDLFGCDPFPNLKMASAIIKGFINLNNMGYEYHWLLSRKSDGKSVGFIDVYLPGPHLLPFRVCEISYGVAAAYRREGYIQEALSVCLPFLFRTEGIHRIEANVNPANSASIALLEKNGFQYEGCRRNIWFWNNAWHDMNLYALLLDD